MRSEEENKKNLEKSKKSSLLRDSLSSLSLLFLSLVSPLSTHNEPETQTECANATQISRHGGVCTWGGDSTQKQSKEQGGKIKKHAF